MQHWADIRMGSRNEALGEAIVGRNGGVKREAVAPIARAVQALSVIATGEELECWSVMDKKEKMAAAPEIAKLITLADDRDTFAPDTGRLIEGGSVEGIEKAIGEGLAPQPKQIARAREIFAECMLQLNDVGMSADALAKLQVPVMGERFRHIVQNPPAKGQGWTELR